MKLTAYYLIVFFLVLAANEVSFGQDTTNRIFQVRIAPLNVFDPMTGVLQLGVQKRFSRRIAVSIDYGIRFNTLSFHAKNERKDYRYYKAKAELKYFYTGKPIRRNAHPYLALQGFYFPQHYRKDNSWLLKRDSSYQFDYSNVSRKVSVGSILIGEEYVIKKMVIDYYYGLGLRKMTITHQPTNAVVGAYSTPTDWGRPPSIDLHEGKFYRLHVVGGFKIGYIIGR